MSHRTRRTVTTIETYEVWIVRKGMAELPDDSVTLMQETEPQSAIPTLVEDNNPPNQEGEAIPRNGSGSLSLKFLKQTKGKGKNMRNRFLMTIGGVAFAGSLIAVAMAVGLSGKTQAAPPAKNCGVHTLRGSYIFNAHGWNIVGGVAVPKAIVEGIDFSGDGTLVVPFATVSINGTIIRASDSGFYTVEPDCTGTLTFSSTGTTFDLFVQPGGGKQVWMIQTGAAVGPPTAVFEGTATKVSP